MSANAVDKKKRGNKGDFHGQRLEFLNVNMERYVQASKKTKTTVFFRRLFKAYWKIFP
jgi:hypothetical protein